MNRAALVMWAVALAAVLGSAAACRKHGRETRWQRQSEASIDLYNQGLYASALPQAEAAVTLAEAAFGREDIRTAYSQDHLGKVLRRTGQMDKARQLFDEAVRTSSQALGPDAPKRAHFLDNLAELLMARGEFDESEKLYETSLHLMQGSFSELSAPVGAAYARLGALYTRWGVYELAEESLRRAGAINSRLDISDDTVSALVAANLGEIRLKTGRLSEARDSCRRALTLRGSLPKNHLDLAQALRNAGLLRLREGSPEEARTSIQRAIDIYRQSPEADPQGLLDAWLDMAEVTAAQGQGEEAEALFGKLLPQLINPYALVKAMVRTARFYQGRGRLEAAESLYLQALAKQVTSPRADRQDREDLLTGLAQVSVLLGKRDKAEGYLQRALETNDELHGEYDPGSFELLAALARLRIARRGFAAARPCCVRMKSLAMCYGTGNPIRRSALSRIAQLCPDTRP